MNKEQLEQLFHNMSNCTVLVLGDLMIDAYVWGKVDRISPEAPVPIVSVSKKEERLGGAANVALNIRALGAKALVCGVVGKDLNAEKLMDLLKEQNLDPSGIVQVEKRPTSIKTRIISSGQHMLRIDEEQTADISEIEESRVLSKIESLLQNQKVDVILFEDYNKGLLTSGLIEHVINLAQQKNIPTAVDPKKQNFLAYKGVSLFKPNLKELREGLKLDWDKATEDRLQEACSLLRRHLQHETSFITLSEMGVFISNSHFSGIIPAHKREIADVSGAGDTVISVAALCLALEVDPPLLASLSNLAGGLVCEEVGVVPINKSKLLQEAIKTLTEPIQAP